MKKLFTAILLLGLLFTTNAQGHEIFNPNDVFDIGTDFGMPDTQDIAINIHNNINTPYGYDYQEIGGSGFSDGITSIGYGENIPADLQINGGTYIEESWIGNYIVTAEWRGNTSDLYMRRAEGSGEAIQANHYTIEYSDYDPRADHYGTKEQPPKLDRNSEVAGSRRNHNDGPEPTL
tara:strand:+ start:21844 stop:22374 length:531 start_codon:yes stop_codon:yes gene_type:complete